MLTSSAPKPTLFHCCCCYHSWLAPWLVETKYHCRHHTHEHIFWNAHNKHMMTIQMKSPGFCIPNNHFVLRLFGEHSVVSIFIHFFALSLTLRIVLSFKFVIAFHAVKLKLNEFRNKLVWMHIANARASKPKAEREKKLWARNKWKSQPTINRVEKLEILYAIREFVCFPILLMCAFAHFHSRWAQHSTFAYTLAYLALCEFQMFVIHVVISGISYMK